MSPDTYIRPFPGVIRIEPAGACNLTCSHCPTGTVKMTRGIMRPETFQKIIQTIGANRDSVRVVVLYHGGEPLLHKDFAQMVKRVKDLGIGHVKTISNGMLLTDETAAGLVSSGLDAIEFSLDGDSPEVNNFIRRNCDYHTVVKNIKRLIEFKRRMQSEKPDIFIATAQFLTLETHHCKGQEPEVPDHLIQEFSGEYAGELAGFKPMYALKWPHMQVIEDIYDVYFDPYDDEIKNECDHVDQTVTIRWDGDVVACCFDLTSRHVLGNIHDEDLAAIWNNQKYRDLRQSIDRREFIPICENCNTVKPNAYLVRKPQKQEELVTIGASATHDQGPMSPEFLSQKPIANLAKEQT